jgi:hypothetical protein
MERTHPKYSVVKSTRVHNTLEIPEGSMLVVSSCKSSNSMFTAFGVNARLSKKNFKLVSKPFKVGDDVYCIDPTDTLTKYAVYRISSGLFSGEVRVTNDNGKIVDVLRSRFSLTLNK